MDKLPISVVIVAMNAARTIEECLDSVQRNNPAEIIVVDGDSSDGTVEIAGRYTERLYSDAGRGLTYARQIGVEKSNQEYVAFVDSDVIMTVGSLSVMLAEFQKSDYVCISASETSLMKYDSYWQWAQYQHYQFHRLQDHISMLASLFRRDTLLKYSFCLSDRSRGYGMDDMDLEIRLRKDGYKFGKSSALFCHRYKFDFRSFIKHRFLYGRLSVCYIRKYSPWHAGFWPPLTRLYWLGFFLLKGKFKLIPYIMVDWVAQTAGMIRGFIEWGIQKD